MGGFWRLGYDLRVLRKMERPLAAEGTRVWPHVFPLLCFKLNVALDHRGNTESRDLRCSGLGRADILVRRQPKLIDLTHPLLWTRMSTSLGLIPLHVQIRDLTFFISGRLS